MWEVKIVDRNKKIIGLKWSGNVKKEEVAEANQQLEKCINELQADSFDLIVEMDNMMAFSKETQQEIVEQQKWVIGKGMKRAAVVVDKATTKMQLRRTSKESNNANEHFFSSYEDALSFLQNG